MNQYIQLSMIFCFFSSLINAGDKNLCRTNLTYAHTIAQVHQAYLASPHQDPIVLANASQRQVAQQARGQNDDDDTYEQQPLGNNSHNFRVQFAAPAQRIVHPPKYQACLTSSQHPARLIITPQAQVGQQARAEFTALAQGRFKVSEQLRTYLRSIPFEQLNTYDGSGQTVAHKLTSVHWLPEVINVAIECGVDMRAQTTAPDRHKGSTLAHNVAGLLYTRSELTSNYTANALRCLRQLWEIDNGAHFNLISLKKTGHGGYCSVWDLLERSGHLHEFLGLLPNHQNTPRKYLLLN